MQCGGNKLAKEKKLLQHKHKNMSAIQLLGLAAGTITSITFLPQVIQIWKTKSAKDLSMQMLLLLIVVLVIVVATTGGGLVNVSIVS